MSSRAISAAALASLVLVLSSCIFLDTEFESNPHCGIAGSSSCATCLRTSCQSSIDACCLSSSCREPPFGGTHPLELLDTCGGGAQARCNSQLSGVQRGTTADGVVACLKTTCKDACLGDAYVEPWSCEQERTSDGACGSCIYERCARAVDACCGDPSCVASSSPVSRTPAEKALAACIGEDAPGCVYAVRTTTSFGRQGELLRCIKEECGSSCLGNGRPHQRCTRLADGSSCRCGDSETPGGDTCNAATTGGTCVFRPSGCDCGSYTCEETAFGCDCRVGSVTAAADWGCAVRSSACCIRFDGISNVCECRSSKADCFSDELRVSSCDYDVVMGVLDEYGLLTDSCSQ